MPSNNQVLSDYTSESSKEIGYDIIGKFVHSKNVSFMKEIIYAIKESMCNNELAEDQVNYFIFLLRMEISLSPDRKLYFFKSCVELKPLWLNDVVIF